MVVWCAFTEWWVSQQGLEAACSTVSVKSVIIHFKGQCIWMHSRAVVLNRIYVDFVRRRLDYQRKILSAVWENLLDNVLCCEISCSETQWGWSQLSGVTDCVWISVDFARWWPGNDDSIWSLSGSLLTRCCRDAFELFVNWRGGRWRDLTVFIADGALHQNHLETPT